MELSIQNIVQPVINSFTYYDAEFDRDVPSAHATLENVSFGIHESWWGNGRDAMAPLRTTTITYDMLALPADHEEIINKIVEAFQEHHNSWMELFSIEMTSTTKTRWYKGHGKVITRDNAHQPKMVITYSEDPRLLDNWSPQKDD